MSLPAAWVDSLFARLAIRYGSEWLRKWEGLNIEMVKSDWAAELGGFANRPEAITHALRSLPDDRPPTVGQFRALCIGAAAPAAPALTYTPDPTVTAIALAAINKPRHGVDPKQWARDLRTKEMGGLLMNKYQRDAWREALHNTEEHA
jgi:hypothetical protein